MPGWSAFFAFLLPLLYEMKLLDTDEYRFGAYMAGVFIAGMGSIVYRNMELGEERRSEDEADFYKKKYNSVFLSLQERTRIFSYIQSIVKEKSTRFAHVCKDLQEAGGQVDASDIFGRITQPKVQIEHILAYLGRFFLHNQEDRVVKITLFTPDNKAGCFRFFDYYPKGERPTTSEETFRLNRGVVGAAYDSGRMIVIDDIEADVASPNPTYILQDNTLPPPKGSIVCYPIHDSERNTTPFVLSLFINVPNLLKESDRDHLERIFSPFAERILLEERLRHLKEDCCGEGLA